MDGEQFGTNSFICDTNEFIRFMVDYSGESMIKISRAIGRSDNYLSTMLSNGTKPSFSLMAQIANACGFGMVITGPDMAFEVVPGSIDTFERLTRATPPVDQWSHKGIGEDPTE